MGIEYKRRFLGIPVESRVLKPNEEVSIREKVRGAVVTRTFVGQDEPGAWMHKNVLEAHKSALGDGYETEHPTQSRFMKPGSSYTRGKIVRHKITAY